MKHIKEFKEYLNESSQKPTDKTIRKYINQYSSMEDPYDVATDIGYKLGWSEEEILKAEKIISNKYIK